MPEHKYWLSKKACLDLIVASMDDPSVPMPRPPVITDHGASTDATYGVFQLLGQVPEMGEIIKDLRPEKATELFVGINSLVEHAVQDAVGDAEETLRELRAEVDRKTAYYHAELDRLRGNVQQVEHMAREGLQTLNIALHLGGPYGRA